MGPLCLLQMYAIKKNKPWRHALQLVICVSELYGGWMTFAPEWVDGSPNLDGSDFVLLWVPSVCMWDFVICVDLFGVYEWIVGRAAAFACVGQLRSIVTCIIHCIKVA